MNKTTTIYIPLGTDIEIEVTMKARFYNGIHSDPKVFTRAPSLTEVLTVADKIKDSSHRAFSQRTTLDYPEQ